MATAKKTVKPVAVATPAAAPKAVKADESAAKKVETPVAAKAEVKAEKPAEKAEKPAAAKKAPAKKEAKPAAKKAPAKKEAKPAAKKAPAKKAELKSSIELQIEGNNYSMEELVNKAKKVWKDELKQKASELVDIKLYIKPEEKTVYCVMNNSEDFKGSFGI